MTTKKKSYDLCLSTETLEVAVDTAMTCGLALRGVWDTTTVDAEIWFSSTSNTLYATVVLPDGGTKVYSVHIPTVEEIKQKLREFQATIVSESSCSFWPAMVRDIEAELFSNEFVGEVRSEEW